MTADTDIDGYDSKTGTFYISAPLTAGESLVVYIPAAARMVSLDISVETGSRFSVYVTNSNYTDAAAEADTVTWYPTSNYGEVDSIFTTKSACAGAYKVVMEAGSGLVKARAK